MVNQRVIVPVPTRDCRSSTTTYHLSSVMTVSYLVATVLRTLGANGSKPALQDLDLLLSIIRLSLPTKESWYKLHGEPSRDAECYRRSYEAEGAAKQGREAHGPGH